MAFGLFLGAALQFVLYSGYFALFIDSLYFQVLPRRLAFCFIFLATAKPFVASLLVYFLAFSLPFVLYFWLLRRRFFYIYSLYFWILRYRLIVCSMAFGLYLAASLAFLHLQFLFSSYLLRCRLFI